MNPITYKDAGVDIEKGDSAIKSIKNKIHSTYSDRVLTDLGSFGGMYELTGHSMQNPVLVSSVDGVGTKLKIAFLTGRHDTIGEDLVNHCVNDIAVGGAKPLYFLDYFACDKLDENVFDQVISGFVRGCKNNNCALIGGETAEMPGMYHPNEYDVSGTIVGIVEKSKIINGSHIKEGDMLLGVNSNGLHTNGFSLARKVLLKEYSIDSVIPELSSTLGDELLRVHYSYLSLIQEAISNIEVNGISHITGGGIIGNTIRILPAGLNLEINWNNWQIPEIFKIIQSMGKVPVEDMRSTFNFGIGLIFIVAEQNTDKLWQLIKKHDFTPSIVGEVVADN